MVEVERLESTKPLFKESKMNEIEEKRVTCVSTCDNFHILRGDHCVLPWTKALILQASGSIKILDDITPLKKQTLDENYLFRSAFSKRPMTRVIWIQNYNKNGGAEISNFNCVAIGRNLGFDVVGLVINENFSTRILKQADVIIVNNLHDSGKEVILDYLNRTTIPWIKYEHDLTETEVDLYRKSKLNVFISPMQQEFYTKKCSGIMSESVCLPLAINPDRWVYKQNSREPRSVFIPAYFKCIKNADKFIKDNPDKRFYVAGDIMPHEYHNVTRVGGIDYKSMPALYHRYETVWHMPDHYFAGDRIIFEAILSGCKLISSDRAGHMSWKFDLNDQVILRKKLKTAIYDFWRCVEKVCNQ